jgi:two-component system cell cycle response regulator
VPTAVSEPQTRRQPALRDAAALIRLDGLSIGEVIPLVEATTTHIGRSRDASVKVEDEGVSRLHAAVHWRDGEHVLVDCGSRNGVAVDGRMVRMHALKDGEVVHLSARSSFRFVLMSEKERDVLKKLFESSVKDPLTGVGNRAYFDGRLMSEVAFAKRHGGAMSLVLVDIDHFKRVNDQHGHQAGDAALKYLAAIATSRLRVEDVFARYGGEEFGVILRGIDLSGAARAAERLRSAIGGGTFAHGETFIPLTVSAGCASLSCCAEMTPEALVEVADRRLYRAKNAGRNRVVATDSVS